MPSNAPHALARNVSRISAIRSGSVMSPRTTSGRVPCWRCSSSARSRSAGDLPWPCSTRSAPCASSVRLTAVPTAPPAPATNTLLPASGGSGAGMRDHDLAQVRLRHRDGGQFGDVLLEVRAADHPLVRFGVRPFGDVDVDVRVVERTNEPETDETGLLAHEFRTLLPNAHEIRGLTGDGELVDQRDHSRSP